ncbi:MAG: UDP-galactopyranose/dTDP-fucopyranose mutase family protein [Elusimicrobiota bacterium]
MKPDILIVGAGPVGSTVAHLCAERLGWKVLILDRRPHIAGNCHDSFHPSGVLIHNYGPHYFRTNREEIVSFLSKFTEWIPGNYVVRSSVGGVLYPFPINLTTLEMFFKRTFTKEQARRFLEANAAGVKSPKNSEEYVVSRVGRELYEKFYRGYTIKQWGKHPRRLSPEVCARIPVRLDRNESYVDHKYQVMPKNGFTAMFGGMIEHPSIRTLLKADYFKEPGAFGAARATLYTGPIDRYFKFRFGKLPWRSLTFDWVRYRREWKQPCVQINYPDERAYTRSVEIKHATGQKHPETVLSYETSSGTGDPYYPVPSPESQRLYARYKALADAETEKNRVYFAGRLATYRYMNTDEAVESAFAVFERIKAAAERRTPAHA